MDIADLSGDQMAGEEREASILQSPVEISGPTGLLDNEMDWKENVCSVQENNLGSSMQRKSSRKGKGCNLRKSLAWNQAFFNEEGVLDPLELSLLDRSSSKSNRDLVSISEMTPVMSYNKSSIRPPLHDVVTNSQRKDSKPRKLFFSSNEAPGEHPLNSGKTPSAKGIFKSMPRSPAKHSQKRVANGNTTNPTSKLPKFTPAKSHIPLPTTSKDTILITKIPKADQNAVSVRKNGSNRPSNAKSKAACFSASSNLLSGNRGKHLGQQVENYTTSISEIPHRLSSTKLREAVTCSPGKAATFPPKSTNQVSGGLPAPTHPRPSALRLPSPSLGFFCQGKVSPSYAQHQIHTQQSKPSEPKISSLRQPINLWKTCHTRPQIISVGQQSTKSTSADNSTAASVISNPSLAYFAASCLKPPASHDTSLHAETHSEMNQASVDKRESVSLESSHLQNDSQGQSEFAFASVGQDTYEQSGVSSIVRLDSDRLIEQKHCDSLSNKRNNSIQIIQQFLEINVPGSCNELPITTDSRRDLACSNESQSYVSTKVRIESGVHAQSRYSHDKAARAGPNPFAIDAELLTESSNLFSVSPVSIENKPSAGASDLGSGFAASNNIFDASTEAKLCPIEEVPAASSNNSSELGHSLSPSSGVCGQVDKTKSALMSTELNNHFLAKNESAHSEESECQHYRSHSDTANTNSSTKQDLLVSRNMIDYGSSDASGQKVLVNAVPFSDEWVAALEAFGEDILVKKTGPVQNSPTDKPLLEPSPWSPVKKKVQEIGPYDCTKYSKNLATS